MVNSRYANAPYSHPPSSYPQHPPGYSETYAQQQQQQQQQHNHQQQHYTQHQQYPQQQQYQPTPPNIRNPFAPPPPARSTYASQNAAFDPEFEAQVAQWQSAYAPQEPQQTRPGRGERADATASNYLSADSNNAHVNGPGRAHAVNSGTDHDDRAGGVISAAGAGTDNRAASTAGDNGKKKTVVRKGGGQTWEDPTLLEWDPTQFRIMVGNLAGEVTDDSLAKAFAQYGVSKARVVRDKRTTKSRGYGFVSFTDGEMGFKAAREMVGKYIGSHPVTIQRSKTDLRPVVQKDRGRGGKNNHHNKNKQNPKQDDPLRAHTGAHIERKPVRNPNGMKMLG